MEVKAEYRAIFAEEAGEHLREWEQALLSLEKTPEDRELVNQIFRAIHTLKGSAGFIGNEELQRLAHQLESSLQAVRDGAARLSPRIVEILFDGLDLCRRMVEGFVSGEPFLEADAGTLLQSLLAEQVGPSGDQEERPAVLQTKERGLSPSGGRVFRLELLIQSRGREAYLRSFLVRNRLAAVATIQSEQPTPEILRDSGERFAYQMTVETAADEEELRQVLNIDLLEVLCVEELKEAQESIRAERPRGAERPPTSPSRTTSETAARAAKAEEVVRVAVEKLDALLNLVGELVIQTSGFVAITDELKARYGKVEQINELETKTEELATITRNLQDAIMKVRMLPVTNVFSRFYRVVRDLAKDRKKEIALEIFGEQTEIDKKVMDRIGDPLVHLVRNAVDHGIESREERLKGGKPPIGRIHLGAYQDGDHICIEVSDDGRGLNRQAVLHKAVEKGLLQQEQAERLTDEQMSNLIFLPGFSTAAKVTEVSGRGVGMDVVKRAIEEMGGSVRLRSVAGRGTKVTLSLPLTMAIIPAVLVEVEGFALAVPLSSVKEVLKVGEGELKSVGNRPVIRLREEILAMVPLRQALSLGGNGSIHQAAERMPVAVVEYEGKKIGLGVDRVLGTAEIVIKSLSRHYREVEGLIGASIMGNGKIALIVDVEALVRQYYHANGREHSITDAEAAPANLPRQDAPEAQSVQVAPEADKQGPAEPGSGEGFSAESLALELRQGGGALLEEIHNTGAIQASMSLSQLTGMEIRVSFPESELVELGDVAEMLGGEENAVAGIYVAVEGELNGGILLVVPEENLRQLHGLLYRRAAGNVPADQEVDLSGISEFGNILSASFINAISDATRLPVRSEAPEISVDMCLAVIDGVLGRFNLPGDHILLTRAVIFGQDSEQVVCRLLMFLEPASLRRLVHSLTDASTSSRK